PRRLGRVGGPPGDRGGRPEGAHRPRRRGRPGRVLRVRGVRDGVPGDASGRDPGPETLWRTDEGDPAASARSVERLAVGDLLRFFAEPLEVLPRPILRDQRVCPAKPPAGEPDPDPPVHSPELPPARRARTRRASPHGLDLLQGLLTGPAPVLVDRHDLVLAR